MVLRENRCGLCTSEWDSARGQGSGGIGILYDRNGNDRYQAGEFSQGVGYFFALGVLYDRSGDDAYRGRRCAQGTSAHQAIEVLFDERGNDRYRAKTAAGREPAGTRRSAYCATEQATTYTRQDT